MHATRQRLIVDFPQEEARAAISRDAATAVATVWIDRLLPIAQEMVANSKAARARGYDAAKWLGVWIERPQPALGGRKPADLIDTPTGIEVVARLLGSIESGTVQ